MGRPRKTPVIEAAETVDAVEAVEVETVEVPDTWGDKANALLDDLVNEPVAAAGPNTVTNIIKGTSLHLGDGRKLAFGESADVPADIAELLRASGQAE